MTQAMPLFPVHRPRVGLSFSGQSLSLVELAARWRPGWRGASLVRASEQPLPPGLLHPSDSVPNVSDVSALAQEVRTLVGPIRISAVALCLPDQAARVGLFEFDRLPKQAAECEALLRWRFREEMNVPSADTRIVYRVFHGTGVSQSGEERAGPVTRVLATSIHRAILAQYEQVCEEAGLLPVAIGLSSLQLFNLCHTTMSPAEELFFAHASPDGFAFLALRENSPVFLRLRSLRQSNFNLLDELTGTLQFYDDQAPHGDLTTDAPARRLFLLDATTKGSDSQDPPEWAAGPAAMITPTGNANWRIQVSPVGWGSLPLSGQNLADCPVSGLSALAGMVER